MNMIDELILGEAQRHIEKEEASFFESEKNLVEIVRRGYDKWIELFGVLKAKKIGCYQRMVEILAGPSFGIKTNPDAVRKAFAKVRQERGVISVTPAAQKIERARYSREELGNPAAGPVDTPAPRVERPVPAVGGPITWSIGSAEEKTPTTFAGVVLKGEVFLRDMAAVKPLMEDLAAQGSEEAVLACLAFLKAYCDKCGFRSSGEGAKLQPHNWLTFLPGLVKSLQNRLSTLEERKAL